MKKLLLLLALLGLATPAAAQNPFSLINFGANPVDTNSGNKSNGTLRVLLATDGPNPTTVFKIDLSGTGANGTAILVTGTGGTFPVTGTVALSNSFLLDATYTGRTPAGASPADGESNTNTALSRRGAFNFIFNGTTWDRLRGAANALNSTGTGIPTAQIVGQFDDVSPTAITENQFGNLRMSTNRNLYGTIRDAAGNERGANVSAGNALLVDASATTQPISAASLPLPSLAATSTKQSDGTQKTQIVDGSGSVIASTSNSLNVQCANCSGSGASAADNATVTEGTSTFAPAGGEFQTTPGTVTTGHQSMVAITAHRAFQVSFFDASGNAMLGSKTSANSLPVVIASDQASVPATLQTQTDTVMVGGVNIKEINGVTPLMGAGATGTGAQRVNDVASSATGAAPPASATYVGGLGSGATGGFLIGPSVGDTGKVINVSTATTTLMITGVSGRQVHITSFHMLTAGANNVAWLEGTGATCGTGTAGMAGGTTAASGYNFAANGGIAMGTGIGDVLRTATTGDSVCLITSAAVQLSGFIEYAIY